MNFERKDKLMMQMICDIHEHLGIDNSYNPKLIRNALAGGHDWAVDWEYGTGIPEEVDSDEHLKQTVDILDMWGFINRGFDALNEADKATVIAALGHAPSFLGFDGNNESEHLGIARFLINEMNRFSEFAGHGLNSHSQSLPRHLDRLAKFTPLRGNLGQQGLTAQQIISILS